MRKVKVIFEGSIDVNHHIHFHINEKDKKKSNVTNENDVIFLTKKQYDKFNIILNEGLKKWYLLITPHENELFEKFVLHYHHNKYRVVIVSEDTEQKKPEQKKPEQKKPEQKKPEQKKPDRVYKNPIVKNRGNKLTLAENIAVLYGLLYGKNNSFGKNQTETYTGRGVNSFQGCKSNHVYLLSNGKKGLAHYSKTAKQVVDKYKNFSELKLRNVLKREFLNEFGIYI